MSLDVKGVLKSALSSLDIHLSADKRQGGLTKEQGDNLDKLIADAKKVTANLGDYVSITYCPKKDIAQRILTLAHKADEIHLNSIPSCDYTLGLVTDEPSDYVIWDKDDDSFVDITLEQLLNAREHLDGFMIPGEDEEPDNYIWFYKLEKMSIK